MAVHLTKPEGIAASVKNNGFEKVDFEFLEEPTPPIGHHIDPVQGTLKIRFPKPGTAM